MSGHEAGGSGPRQGRPGTDDGKGTDVHRAAAVGDIEQKLSDDPELKKGKGTDMHTAAVEGFI